MMAWYWKRISTFIRKSEMIPANTTMMSHYCRKREIGTSGAFSRAIAAAVSPIVVDRGNGLNAETRRYAAFAVEHHYAVELKKPDSPWWLELRVLLEQPRTISDDQFDHWAERLAAASKSTHRVPVATIRQWMKAWRHDLTVNDILNYQGKSEHD